MKLLYYLINVSNLVSKLCGNDNNKRKSRPILTDGAAA